jgi:hypothetical protein
MASNSYGLKNFQLSTLVVEMKLIIIISQTTTVATSDVTILQNKEFTLQAA